MARVPRICRPGIAQHVIQRGNNRQICLAAEENLYSYSRWLSEYGETHGMDVHAYVLMTNHVHILATPQRKDMISETMQSPGRRYVRYFNATYRRTGALWEGRYESCLAEQEKYLGIGAVQG